MKDKNELVDWETWREDVSDYLRYAIQTKETLLLSISNVKKRYLAEAASGEGKHTAAYYSALDKLLEQFEAKVESTNFPDPLPEPCQEKNYADCWVFAYEISPLGITLSLELDDWVYNDGSPCLSIQESFKIIEVPAKLLTVSEYAQRHGLDPAVVRERLDSDEIRGAVKAGDEWRLSELAEVSEERNRQNTPFSIACY